MYTLCGALFFIYSETCYIVQLWVYILMLSEMYEILSEMCLTNTLHENDLHFLLQNFIVEMLQQEHHQ